MLETIFGSKNRERVLQFILANGEGYAKEIADFYGTSIDPIQKQLEKMERGGVLVSKVESTSGESQKLLQPRRDRTADNDTQTTKKVRKTVMKSIKEMTMEELAAYVCSQLEKEIEKFEVFKKRVFK